MILCKWEKLPLNMQTADVRKYYDILRKKKLSLFCKRIFDIIVSLIMIIIILPLLIALAAAIKLDSQGPVFYRQVRVTQYGKTFRIFKFRTMVQNADEIGTLITVDNDARITRVGKIIRRFRLDEICQLIDILRGTMTFVGTRPEVPKYVAQYTSEMLASLLLPAGVTSEASIYYKDEDKLLQTAYDVEKVYIEVVLPGKMKYNMQALIKYSFWRDIKVMFMTVLAMMGKGHNDELRSQSDMHGISNTETTSISSEETV